jgi:hypothetical protein
LEEGGAVGVPEGWGEVGAGYVAAAAVEDYAWCCLGWFGLGRHGGFGFGGLGVCDFGVSVSFGGSNFGFEYLD